MRANSSPSASTATLPDAVLTHDPVQPLMDMGSIRLGSLMITSVAPESRRALKVFRVALSRGGGGERPTVAVVGPPLHFGPLARFAPPPGSRYRIAKTGGPMVAGFYFGSAQKAGDMVEPETYASPLRQFDRFNMAHGQTPDGKRPIIEGWIRSIVTCWMALRATKSPKSPWEKRAKHPRSK